MSGTIHDNLYVETARNHARRVRFGAEEASPYQVAIRIGSRRALQQLILFIFKSAPS